jgi:hypothetical protein
MHLTRRARGPLCSSIRQHCGGDPSDSYDNGAAGNEEPATPNYSASSLATCRRRRSLYPLRKDIFRPITVNACASRVVMLEEVGPRLVSRRGDVALHQELVADFEDVVTAAPHAKLPPRA